MPKEPSRVRAERRATHYAGRGNRPKGWVAAINSVMHQEASDEGVHLVLLEETPPESLKRGLCSLLNDRALDSEQFQTYAEVEQILPY